MFESFSIQIEVMKRLPVESLIRCRSVSKAWKSLIDSSQFITAHSHHTHPRHLLVINFISDNDDEDDRAVCLSSFSDGDTFPQKEPGALPAPSSLGELVSVSVAGSSRGLICLHGNSPAIDNQKAVIWNPSIRKSVAVPFPVPYSPYIGFGVCPVTLDPKLLWVSDGQKCAKVWTLSSREWRSIKMPPHEECCWAAAVTTQRFIYLPIFVCEKLVSFDLTSETFEATDVPDGLILGGGGYYMSQLRESLAVIVPEGSGTKLAVWALEDYGAQRSFRKLFNIICPSQYDRVLEISHNDMLIMLMANPDYDDYEIAPDSFDSPSLVVFKPNSNVLKTEELTHDVHALTKLLEIKGFSYDAQVHTYEETLLLLNCRNSI